MRTMMTPGPLLRHSLFLIVALLLVSRGSASLQGPETLGLTDVLLREMVARMGNDLADPSRDYFGVEPESSLDQTLGNEVSLRAMKEFPPPPRALPLDYEDALALSPSIRDQEYLAHSSLLGSLLSNYAPGKQRIKPTDTRPKNTAEIKADGVLPAYCNPPNPCPVGYTAMDGCLEEFENTAAFSRDYQAMQDCMCDTEHMFECPDSTRDSEISALARSIQNEGVLDSTIDKIIDDLDAQRRHMVAKKFHQTQNFNPYLQGERLPIAAKKGSGI